MSIEGLLIGVIAFLVIGAFHPIIIKAEFFFSERVWPAFLAVGLVGIGLSVWVRPPVLSAAFGILGCTSLWSILELKEQTRRVERGWFPKNPNRAAAHGPAAQEASLCPPSSARS
jgi:dolichyl-phosphate-mannose--protein O-mannosyl transferase